MDKTPNKLHEPQAPDQALDVGKARTHLSPIVQAARTSRRWLVTGGELDLASMVSYLGKQTQGIRDGDMAMAENMLATRPADIGKCGS